MEEGAEDGEGEQGDQGGAEGLGDAQPGCGAHLPAEGLGGVLVDERFGDERRGGEEEDCEAEAEGGVDEELVDFRVPG